MDLRLAVEDVVRHAIGRSRRSDPTIGFGGGPAGNGRLTAWTGLLLLVLFGAELVTLVDVRSLVDWHIVIGVVLVPPALLKTATTGWRIVRYYTGSSPYREAGPPPLILRLLGPLVVVSTLAVLGTGIGLALAGPDTSRRSIAGTGIDLLTLHKGSFVVWAVATGLHVLGRVVSAVQAIAATDRVPGRIARASLIGAMVATAVVAAVLLTSTVAAWRHDRSESFSRDRPGSAGRR